VTWCVVGGVVFAFLARYCGTVIFHPVIS